MSLASPDKLIWLLAAFPIIAFYILKTRLRRRPVSTLLFWDQIFEQKRQRSLWQNLRHWMSLLLQLIFVSLLGFALAEPLWNSQDQTGQDLILVIDNSASMQALDDASGQTRLERAIELGSDVAGTLRNGDNIALITAGSTVRVVVGMNDFAPSVQDALLTIQPTDGPTRLEEAILTARRLAGDPERRRIVVVSDGGTIDRDELAEQFASPDESFSGETMKRPGGDQAPKSQELIGDDIQWIQVGQPVDNVAITTFQVRRSVVDPIGYSLLVEVQNFSDEPVETRLTLKLDESLVDVIPMVLPADGSFKKQIDATSQSGGTLVGELKINDALAIDDTARAILPDRPNVNVRLFANESTDAYYLRRVLESIPLVRLTEAVDDRNGPDASAPVLRVYAGVVPEMIPDGPLLFVDIPESGPEIGQSEQPAWRLGEQVEQPIIAKQETDSPLLRHVQLQNVILAGGRDLEVNEELGQATTLLTTAGGQRVCYSIERPEGRILMLASDLDSSDLPLRIAFPVMMSNAMNWFFRQSGDIQPAIATGRTAEVPWDLPEDSSGGIANLRTPAGEDRIVTVRNDRARLSPLHQVGLYQLTEQSAQQRRDLAEKANESPTDVQPETISGPGSRIAVNLADANESDLRIPTLPASSSAELPPAGRSPWFYLILAACVLVLTEWALFQRRVVA